jgi:hypothetical protein
MYLCPICDGDGPAHCYCDRRGLVSQADIDGFLAAWPECPVRPLPPPPAAMDKPCHDCAFRGDSPEREDPWGTWLKILEGVAEGAKFFCHQGMHCTPDGRYVPNATDAKGQPAGHPVCAGWLAMRRRVEAGRLPR